MKKILIIFVALFMMIFNVNALEITSEHAVMYNLNDNKIVYEKNKDEITSIASLTKIMTTLVAIEQIADINKTVVLNNSMFEGLYEAEAAVIGLKDGQVLTYEDLLYGTFISSGADATRALTISLAGSETNFVKLMNDKAKELGLVNTKYINATGLDEIGQISTVDEVARLLKVALENKLFKTIFESRSYTLSDDSMTIYSTLSNTSIRYGLNINSVVGAKTGYTDDAGFCLASVGHDKTNDIKYLLVTTKAPISFEKANHLEDAIEVYDYYFNNYKYYNLVDKDAKLLTFDTKYSKLKNVSFKAPYDVKYYSDSSFNKEQVRLKYNGPDVLKPFTKVGKEIGTLDIMYGDQKVNTISVTLQEKVPFSIIQFLKSNILIIILIIILGRIIKKRKRKKKTIKRYNRRYRKK